MKSQWTLFFVSFFSSIVSILLLIFVFPCDLGYDICVGVFSAGIVSLFTSFILVVTERREKIRKALLQIRHIKALSNDFSSVDNRTNAITLCSEIIVHYDIARDAFETIQDIPFPNRHKLNDLFICLSNYTNIVLGTKDGLRESSDKEYLHELDNIQSFGIVKMESLLELWKPLVIKYEGKKMYKIYCDADEIHFGAIKYKTIREILGDENDGTHEI